MRRLPALVAALLLPAAQPVLLGTALSSASLLVSQAPAQAQSAEAVGKVAQAITVRIEGATQGSGVLVKRDGNRYTVLTAWHVVSGQRPGEELEVVTPDGQRHQLEQGSIQQLGEVDMALLFFPSDKEYEIARPGDLDSVGNGETIYVSGFPVGVQDHPILKKGRLVARAFSRIDSGYQLLYTNHTSRGMSGGPILSLGGALLGVHGRGEMDELETLQHGREIKTGINQGVPVTFFRLYSAGLQVLAAYSKPLTTDDLLANARFSLKNQETCRDAVKELDRLLSEKQNYEAFMLRGIAKFKLGRPAIDDFTSAIKLNPHPVKALLARAIAKQDSRDMNGALEDYSSAIRLDPTNGSLYLARGRFRQLFTRDLTGALEDYSFAINANPKLAEAFHSRGILKAAMRIRDFSDDLDTAKRMGHKDEPWWRLTHYLESTIGSE